MKLAVKEYTNRSLSYFLLTFLSALTIVALICIFGNIQFGGNDFGVLIDSSYRLFYGYHPYIDFPTTQPILFYLGGLWALQIFGLHWSSFVYINALYSFLTFLVQFIILKRIGISFWWNLALTISIQLAAMFVSSTWWYNPITCVAVSLLCMASILVLTRSNSIVNWCLYCGCLFLASLTKPNMAGIAIMACALALFIKKETRWKSIVSASIAFNLFAILIAIYHISLYDLLTYYLGGAERGIPTLSRLYQDFENPLVIIWALALIPITLIPLVSQFLYCIISKKWPGYDLSFYIIVIGCCLAGIYGCFTNGESTITEVPIIITPVALFCLLKNVEWTNSAFLKYFNPIFLQVLVLTITISTAITYGVTRYRIKLIGIGSFYEDSELKLIGSQNQFFASLRSGPILNEILHEITEVINRFEESKFIKPTILFGPRMNWGYAAFNLIPPPKNFPYSWWPGVDYPSSFLPVIVNSFSKNMPDMCIFLKSNGIVDLPYMPKEITILVENNYHPVFNFNNMVVFLRNDIAL